MAGLAAGIRLAMYDRKVLILEKHSIPGGLNSFYSIAGRKFDVGLHAVTNVVPPGHKGTPLPSLLRQLRIPRDAFDLNPQRSSRIAFPGADLRFTNSFGLLEEEVDRQFPGQIEAFRRFRKRILEASPGEGTGVSSRGILAESLPDPLLREMLLCPIMYYGASTAHDIDFSLFVTLWKSVFEEGFGRPLAGIRTIIRALLDRYREVGGTRRMKCGVRRILVDEGIACGVELEDGEELTADRIISTAGEPETRILCGAGEEDPAVQENIGRLAFAETISILSRQPEELGIKDTIVFFNDSPLFHYEQAASDIDLRSGVICCPNNYAYPEGTSLDEGILRVTTIASYENWTAYSQPDYEEAKERWFSRMVESALNFLPGVDPELIRSSTVFRDMFTPRTVRKYTGRLGGAIYGAGRKSPDGTTGVENLFLAGTDQGLLGIVGAMFSGVTIANRHVLMAGRK